MTEHPEYDQQARVLRVLQVEDVETDAELIIHHLKRTGWRLKAAASGRKQAFSMP
jgi:CheY-like chemotaxis protein